MTRSCGRQILAVHGGPGMCLYPRMKGKQRCEWHWLLAQSAHAQEIAAAQRLFLARQERPDDHIARVPKEQWPNGERWCAGCQAFVPLFYCSGSRCKSCSSKASHEARVQATYGLAPGEYDELYLRQAGRCFICQRESKGKRFAVDHDHVTGKVRGLLCANNEHGCNAGVVGNLESAHDGGLAAAKRAVLYLAHPPYDRLQAGHQRLTWDAFVRSEVARLDAAAKMIVPGGGPVPPEAPF